MKAIVIGGSIEEQTAHILSSYGLDFHIHKLPLKAEHKTEDGNGIIEVPTKTEFGLFNGKTWECLNVVKDSYRVSQNDEVVGSVLKGAEGFGQLSVTKAGALHGGRKVFIQLAVEGLARVGGDDVKQYLTVIDSNDGSTGLSVGIGNLTMSCQNQFYKFYKQGQMKMRHSSSMDERIKELPHLITLALSETMQLMNMYKDFQSTAVSRNLANEMVLELLDADRVITPIEKQAKLTNRAISNMDNLYDHIDKEMNDKGDNLWGLFSGVTSWTTHQKQAPKRDNGRLESLIMGTNYRTNQDALNFCKKKLAELV